MPLLLSFFGATPMTHSVPFMQSTTVSAPLTRTRRSPDTFPEMWIGRNSHSYSKPSAIFRWKTPLCTILLDFIVFVASPEADQRPSEPASCTLEIDG